MFILPKQALVLRAWAAFGDLAPSNIDFKSHWDYAEKHGEEAYVDVVNSYIAGMSNTDLAKILLKTTGLNAIDIDGDASTDNTAAVVYFLEAYSANRAGLVLDFLKSLSAAVNDPGLGGIAKAFNDKINRAYAHANNEGNVTVLDLGAAQEIRLTTGEDDLKGFGGDDLFKARVIDNTNTLQSGDRIDGGAGNDMLDAVIGRSQQFAILAETKNVEHVKIRAQTDPQDATHSGLTVVQIDADSMKDVLNWENYRSRSDLVVEDVNINDNQITKDITVTMRETAPGHVDYGVYFAQHSLRNSVASTSRINVQIMDTRSAAAGGNDLAENAVSWKMSGFNVEVSLDGGVTKTVVTLSHPDMQTAVTVAEMRAAFEKAVAAQFPGGEVSVLEGPTYTAVDTKSGKIVRAKEIAIVAKGSVQFFNDPGITGWKLAGSLGLDSGLHAFAHQNAVVDADLVTSKVVLDEVGSGSTGGDLVIGGYSVGSTSTSKGVGRFEITVEDDSVLRTISSTNDTLQEVVVVNGKTSRVASAYSPLEKDAGKLVVKGEMEPNLPALDPRNTPLPGGSTSEYGFQDVRLIDGSAMTGKLEFNAEITQNAVKKYLDLRDAQPNPTDEDIAVEYTGGANNDKMWVNIDEGALASHSKIKPGRADFRFKFDGGKGDDTLNVAIDRVVDASLAPPARGQSKFQTDLTEFDVILWADTLEGGGTTLQGGPNEAWYHNQRSNGRDRFVIDGGEGNDFIVKPGAGDTTLKAGVGADVVFADNTGADQYIINAAGDTVFSKAVWAFNTFGNLPLAHPLYDANALSAVDLKALAPRTARSWGMKVQVNYRGLLSEEIAIDDLEDFRTNQLEINQAVKKAINEDGVLGKLLQAVDGPGTSLLVQSKVDGVHDANALSINFVAPVGATITQEVVNGYNNAHGTAYTVANFLANMTADFTGSTINLGYATQMAQDFATVDVVGGDSGTTSDNRIHPGVDQDTDVLVLGTMDANSVLPTLGAMDPLVGAFAAIFPALPVAPAAPAQRNAVVAALEAGKTWAAPDLAEIRGDLKVGLDAALNAFKANPNAAVGVIVGAFNAAIAAAGTLFAAGAISGAVAAIAAMVPPATGFDALVHLETLSTLVNELLDAAADNTFTTGAQVMGAVNTAVDVAHQTAAYDSASISSLNPSWSEFAELWSSNDTVVFEGGFGHDVIVNFNLGGAINEYGHDKLDFTKLGGRSGGFVNGVAAIGAKGAQVVTDGNIQMFNYVPTAGNNPANDTAEKVKELYTDGLPAAIAKEIYIAVDNATGTGHVYQVVDGVAANDLQVIELGMLDLSVGSDSTADFNWAALRGYNFV